MSKTITIPSDRGSIVTVSVNGRDYSYKAGQTVSVPDEVAALFESNAGENVVFGRRATSPLEASMRKGGKSGVSAMVDDEGRLFVPMSSTTDGIHVEEHKLIIPQTEE